MEREIGFPLDGVGALQQQQQVLPAPLAGNACIPLGVRPEGVLEGQAVLPLVPEQDGNAFAHEGVGRQQTDSIPYMLKAISATQELLSKHMRVHANVDMHLSMLFLDRANLHSRCHHENRKMLLLFRDQETEV